MLIPKAATTPLATGQAVETQAMAYLAAQGLQCLHRNFRCKEGEIDLIAEQGDQLIFVEVRFRQKTHYGSAQDSISRLKQRKIIKTAAFFLYRYPHYANHACRFDVIGVTLKDQRLDFDWIQHAFY